MGKMDDMFETVAVTVMENTQPGEARRVAITLARQLGFDETTAGRLAIVVTEAATNIVKHGGGGEILIRPLREDGERGIELLALDKGSGIANLPESRRDGVSRTGSAGTGLGAIGRLADMHDIYSQPERGTAVLARIWQERQTAHPAARLLVGAVSVAMPGETTCGDGWSVALNASGAVVLVVDGLGHGLLAAEASREAVRVFRKRPMDGPVAVLQTAHAALRSTRGAAGAVAHIDCDRRVITYAGVGNIAGVVLAASEKLNMASYAGTLGHVVRTFAGFTYAWPEDAMMVLNSDGLVTRWTLDPYPGISAHDASLIAGVLYRDFNRGHDDATVVVIKQVAA
jgi:anti-sigma regulatory factor (Ser/Thr protein kinase)